MARMRRRKMVFVDLWSDSPGAVDTFRAQCSPVYTLYTHALHAGDRKILATASWTRIFLAADPPGRSPADRPTYRTLGPSFVADADEPEDNLGFSDGGEAQIDAALLGLPAAERGERYLEWLHDILLRLARLRGWDAGPLHDARRYCLDREVRARFDAPRRQSPDRRHLAGLQLEIDPDGRRHFTITVTNRVGQHVGASTTTVEPFACGFHEWRTVQRRLRWTSPVTVEFDDGSVVDGTYDPIHVTAGSLTLDGRG